MPQPTGSGASLRFFSNARAWIDLGFETEIVQVSTDGKTREPAPELRPVRWAHVEAHPVASVAGKLAYRAGLVTSAGCAYCFAKHRAVLRAVAERQAAFPGSLHQFEGDSTANALPFAGAIRGIYSAHDIPSQIIAAVHQLAAETGRRALCSRQRELDFVRKAERRMVASSRLTLCISTADHALMRTGWGYRQTEYLPMSVADEHWQRAAGIWAPAGVLRLLHIGSVNHLPSYRSLEFLLGQVFPIMTRSSLARLRLTIVGHFDPDHPRCRHIAALAEPFRDIVQFAGFVREVKPVYDANDLQVAVPTQATGLRTRIVESFAYGLPVLATRVGASGIEGLVDGVNILLADDAPTLARTLDELPDNAARLANIAAAGRLTYDTHYARCVVACRLAALIEQYFGIRCGGAPTLTQSASAGDSAAGRAQRRSY